MHTYINLEISLQQDFNMNQLRSDVSRPQQISLTGRIKKVGAVTKQKMMELTTSTVLTVMWPITGANSCISRPIAMTKNATAVGTRAAS